MRAAAVIDYSFTDPLSWSQALMNSGFVHSDGAWRREAMLLSFKGDWITLETNECPNHAAPSTSDLTCPGFWKIVGCAEFPRFVFEIPAALVSTVVEVLEDNSAISPEALLDWALASQQGEVRLGWKPPSDDLIKSWMPAGALTVRAGSLVRQGEISTDDGWHLRFPLLPGVPANLPQERRVALDLLAADAQSRLRMVRIGWMNSNEAQGLVAFVDLTGAPPVPALFLAALEGLSHAVAWLAETANVLADVNVALRSLEQLPAVNPVRKESA